MNKQPSTTGKSEQVQLRPVSAPSTSADDLLAQEERYRLMNAELETKTTEIVKQAQQLLSDQNEALSKLLPVLHSNITCIEDTSLFLDYMTTKLQPCTVQDPGVKGRSKKKMTSTAQSLNTKEQVKKFQCKRATSNESAEAKVEDAMDPVLDEAEDNTETDVLDAQTQVLKAKLRILQEERDQLSSKYYKKDDENAQFSAKIKELEEDRAKLQKTASIQQTQTEKYKTLAEESSKKCDGLQLQVSALNKEIEDLNGIQKKAAATHTTAEVRLNRVLEEVAKLRNELKDTKQMTMISKDDESRENLLAENKMLKKQKAELLGCFKKQLKLIKRDEAD
ncbi:testis-expressed protein 9-like [Cololabis saira]|uniref:testis-expressed protein 9-like n=1 Tax=Cololabis saira TaxID=129043 RepID=UPI002AD3BD91|nr:testis-expressed protein 9-like [Cololabis saira]